MYVCTYFSLFMCNLYLSGFHGSRDRFIPGDSEGDGTKILEKVK